MSPIFATPTTKTSQMKTPSAPIKTLMRNIRQNHQGAPPRALFVIPSSPTKPTELMIPDAPTCIQLYSCWNFIDNVNLRVLRRNS
uniref:Uncharacterized protein n=1 Tax=Caenorhabditis japonica TaxID=281687 RepID=A0A8R1EDA4_CAEJA